MRQFLSCRQAILLGLFAESDRFHAIGVVKELIGPDSQYFRGRMIIWSDRGTLALRARNRGRPDVCHVLPKPGTNDYDEQHGQQVFPHDFLPGFPECQFGHGTSGAIIAAQRIAGNPDYQR